MPAVTTIVAVAGIGVAAAGVVGQQKAAKNAAGAQRQSAAAQRDQAALEQRRADIQNARNLRAEIRQSRIAAASIRNQGANAGTFGSSGVLGGISSVGAQHASNVGNFNQNTEINSAVFGTQVQQANANLAFADAQADGAMWGAIGGLGGTVFQGAGGFKTIFSTKT